MVSMMTTTLTMRILIVVMGIFFLVQGGVFHVDSDKGNDGHDDDDDVMTMV